MEPGTLLLDLALLGLVAYLVLRPWLRQARTPQTQADPAEPLLAERERLLAALRELELDQATGKIEAEEGAQQRTQLVAQGASVLRQLDELAAKPAGRRKAQPKRTADEEIEAAIRQVRQRQSRRVEPTMAAMPAADSPRACPACGQASQPGDRFCAGCGAELGAACGQCGTSLADEDRFCPQCGTRVPETSVSTFQPEVQR